MKKLILTLGIVLSGVLCLQAQTQSPSLEKRTNVVTSKITQVCNLTPDQVTKVQPMVSQFVQAHAANRQKYAGDPTGLKTANQSTNKLFKSQLATVLSADQMSEFTAMSQKAKAARAAKSNAPTQN